MHKIGLIGDKKYNGILHGSPVYVLQVPSHVVKSVNVRNVEDHQKSMERSQPITVDVSGLDIDEKLEMTTFSLQLQTGKETYRPQSVSRDSIFPPNNLLPTQC